MKFTMDMDFWYINLTMSDFTKEISRIIANTAMVYSTLAGIYTSESL